MDYAKVKGLLKTALKEDIGKGDATTISCIPEDRKAIGSIIAKQEGIICGLDLVQYIFDLIDDSMTVNLLKNDGDLVKQGDLVAEITGSAMSMLSAERTILNFLQNLSGVATTTYRYTERIKDTKTRLLDTRKTTPGFRYLQKYAVKTGGGKNHRQGLYDMILIKDNHIAVNGSITDAVSKAKDMYPNLKIEVECDNLEQVKEAAVTDCDWIMLDNMTINEVKKSLKIISKQKTEASGGITLDNLRGYAMTGVDYISVGALTHSFFALDLSMKIKISQ